MPLRPPVVVSYSTLPSPVPDNATTAYPDPLRPPRSLEDALSESKCPVRSAKAASLRCDAAIAPRRARLLDRKTRWNVEVSEVIPQYVDVTVEKMTERATVGVLPLQSPTSAAASAHGHLAAAAHGHPRGPVPVTMGRPGMGAAAGAHGTGMMAMAVAAPVQGPLAGQRAPALMQRSPLHTASTVAYAGTAAAAATSPALTSSFDSSSSASASSSSASASAGTNVSAVASPGRLRMRTTPQAPHVPHTSVAASTDKSATDKDHVAAVDARDRKHDEDVADKNADVGARARESVRTRGTPIRGNVDVIADCSTEVKQETVEGPAETAAAAAQVAKRSRLASTSGSSSTDSSAAVDMSDREQPASETASDRGRMTPAARDSTVANTPQQQQQRSSGSKPRSQAQTPTSIATAAPDASSASGFVSPRALNAGAAATATAPGRPPLPPSKQAAASTTGGVTMTDGDDDSAASASVVALTSPSRSRAAVSGAPQSHGLSRAAAAPSTPTTTPATASASSARAELELSPRDVRSRRSGRSSAAATATATTPRTAISSSFAEPQSPFMPIPDGLAASSKLAEVPVSEMFTPAPASKLSRAAAVLTPRRLLGSAASSPAQNVSTPTTRRGSSSAAQQAAKLATPQQQQQPFRQQQQQQEFASAEDQQASMLASLRASKLSAIAASSRGKVKPQTLQQTRETLNASAGLFAQEHEFDDSAGDDSDYGGGGGDNASNVHTAYNSISNSLSTANDEFDENNDSGGDNDDDDDYDDDIQSGHSLSRGGARGAHGHGRLMRGLGLSSQIQRNLLSQRPAGRRSGGEGGRRGAAMRDDDDDEDGGGHGRGRGGNNDDDYDGGRMRRAQSPERVHGAGFAREEEGLEGGE